ncbi:MAG: bifunctional alpha,alpha-trehalose-phosphate synthase (UDP-forming)/trehalose-phosphatase, partial [Myxococcaceae bacterium]
SGDTLWVHDYQLLLVPQLLRERLPQARIGFFLHIPFPSDEIFRTLPWRSELLEGVLGADLIGFHSLGYVRHFGNALTQLLGLTPEADRVRFHGRTVRLGAFPMGIDSDSFAKQGQTQETLAEVEAIRRSAEGQKLLVGVDRLDYTKGIRRRLLAVGRLLEREPQLRGKIRFVQVAVPSRTEVADYETHRKRVDELVGRINGAYATPRWTPIHYLFRSVSSTQLSALYRAADVMLVTPLRDGMNLVAKEFIASRVDGDGVLVLSEFAGAASELGEAISVNPYDVDGVAASIKEALTMPEDERRIRMEALRERVMRSNVHHWAKRFLEVLEEPAPPEETATRLSKPEVVAEAREKLRAAKRWCLFLDYDGTLRDFAAMPELATPDSGLISLLTRLTQRPGAEVHVVSGRKYQFLEKYLGSLKLALHAEHGLLSRAGPDETWRRERDVTVDWKDRVRPILETFVDRTPGSFIEEKTASLAWHYRKAESHFAQQQARELQLHLNQTFSNTPIELLPGDKVLEVRAVGIQKGLIVPAALKAAGEGALILAMGDDRTDEDLFAALPEDALTFHVGPQASRATYRLPTANSARAFLSSLL